MLVYKCYGSILRSTRGSWEQFNSVWGGLIDCVKVAFLSPGEARYRSCGWIELKAQNDITALDDTDEDDLSGLTERALICTLSEDVKQQEEICDVKDTAAAAVRTVNPDLTQFNPDLTQFNPDFTPLPQVVSQEEPQALSQAVKATYIEWGTMVTKWLQKADRKYRDMFFQQIGRLAEGERSYSLRYIYF